MHIVYLNVCLLFASGALCGLFQIYHKLLFLGFCLSRQLGKCDLCHPIHAAVLHVTVSSSILKAVMMTAICKRSFSKCNLLFSGVPFVLYADSLEKKILGLER